MQITIREPGSALTHFIAMMMAVFASVPLTGKSRCFIRRTQFYRHVYIHGKHDFALCRKYDLSFCRPKR